MVASLVLPFSSASPLPFAGLGSSLKDLLQRWTVSVRRLRPRANEAVALHQRLYQTQKRLRAGRRRVNRLPLASRERCAARFEVLSLEAMLRAHQAVAAGQGAAAARHSADAGWFAKEARRLACWNEAR